VIRTNALVLAFLWLCLPTVGWAFATLPTDEFGLGGRDTAMGMAYTAAADDFTSVYYNPAGLAVTRPGLAFDFGYKAYGRLFSVPGEDAQNFANLPVVGVAYRRDYSVAPGWLRLPALGFAAMAVPPDLRRQREDNTPHSIRYNSQGLIPIYIGAGYEIMPGFSIGATLALGFAGSFQATAVTAGTPVTPEVTGLSLSGPVQIAAAPHAGILLGPFSNWRFGLAFRDSQSVDVDTSFRVEPGPGSVTLPPPLGLPLASFEFVTGWSPKQIAAGVAYDGLSGWLFSADLVVKKWDEWISSTGREPNPEFRNRLVPRLGIERQLTQFLAVQGGYYFEPTPVPPQSGDTSYVDNDQHVFSFGLSYALDRFVRLRTVIAPTFQVHWLPGRTTRKTDPTNAVFPGYHISGAVLSGGFVIRVYP
jgi:long-chain fatty acid transport protein